MKRISIYFIMLVAAFSLSIGAQAKSVEVKTAGTLSQLLSQEEINTLTELIVSGPLNGDDILTIRSMRAHLQILNLQNANIVEGGNKYDATNSTTNNVIGNRMFYGMSILKTLILPNSVTQIGARGNSSTEAIAQCPNLESVTLPSSLTYIGAYAFNNCTQLKSIQIPEGVTHIGTYAFKGCKTLASVTLPKTFGQTSADGSLYLYFLNRSWASGSDYTPDYNSPLGAYAYTFSECENLSEVILPEGLEALAPYMFDGCKSLVSVTLPSTMKVLNGAFQNTGITGITLPEGLIQVHSFRGCTQLKSITIPEGAGYLYNGAFSGCTSLISVQLPQTITTLPGNAFENCTSLSEIIIPDNVNIIYDNAFQGCTELTTVKLPAQLSSIERQVFQGCSKLATIELPAAISNIGARAFDECSLLESINLPPNIVTIGNYAFRLCTSLKSVQLPPNLTEIADYTFVGCAGLENVSLPTNLSTIGREAFRECTLLKEITIPGGVQTVNDMAFSYCGLKKVVLEMGIISIDRNAFYKCEKLEEVVFPESMTALSGFNSTGIKEIVFPKNVTEIKADAFHDCDSLRSVTIPEGVVSIKSSAFGDCDSLKTVTLPTSLKEIGEYAFESTDLKEITLPQGITTIQPGTFKNCDNLETIKLPESITAIKNNNNQYGGAFSGCSQLKSISLPAGLTELGAFTFSSCKELSDITLPTGLTAISEYTFYYCQKLTKIEIPANITTIGQYAFSESGLKDINIPATVTTVGYCAFYINWSNYINGQTVYHRLNSATWNTTNDFPTDAFSQMNYLYVPEGTNVSDKNIAKYIFYDGVTDQLKIEAQNGYFGIGKEIKAKNVSYSKQFTTSSGYNEPAGWRTLVLPFSVDKFTYTGNGWSDDGTENEPLAPFGSELLAQDETARPFWLYELTATGYQATTKIEANKPYLICMPNNYAYPESSNIRGWVRFSAENAAGITLAPTEGALQTAEGATYNLIPTYETISKSEQVYTLNETESFFDGAKDYLPGSVFIRNYADVAPFQAYVQTKAAPASAPRLYSIGGDGGSITGIGSMILTPDRATKAYSENGILYIESNAVRTIPIYDASGRTIRVIEAQEGRNEVNGLAEGIYFLEGQKVMVKK